ncbi:MAG: permease [Planctomycetes bacterium]|nr:permease [Planctomycetota bacterium]
MNYYGLLVPAGILVALIWIAYARRGAAGVGAGFAETGGLLWKVAPNLAIGFTLAGFLTLLLPQDMVARWLGAEAGARGIFVGMAAGALTPGGPFTHFPILASLMVKGATIGPISAYIAAWALLGVHRILIWEGPVMGWKFVAVRAASCVVLPPLAGFAAQWIARVIR